VNLTTPSGVSQELTATNFGFTIPAGAVINGVQVDIEWWAINDIFCCVTAGQNDVTLLKAGIATGANRGSIFVALPTSNAFTTFGSNSDLWGATWTSSDINATNFGVQLSLIDNTGAGNGAASVDFVQITVTFTPPAGGNRRIIQTRSSGEGRPIPSNAHHRGAATRRIAVLAGVDVIFKTLEDEHFPVRRPRGDSEGTDQTVFGMTLFMQRSSTSRRLLFKWQQFRKLDEFS